MSHTQTTAPKKVHDRQNQTDEDNVFKKTEQTVGKPQLSGDINDEYFRNPPQNHPPGSDAKVGGQDYGNKSETTEEFMDRIFPHGAMGEQINGRIKQMDVESSLILEDETGAHQ